MSPNPTASHLGPNGRGFSEAGPWLAYYGQANDLGDLDAIAKTYRLFVIQATSFDALQIAKLQAGGRNRVLTYLDLGSVEHSASWWNDAPTGFLPAGQAKAAQIGPYGGYPDETWMNPANTDWRHLLVDYIAPKQLAAGADGFFFDNLELLEHGSVQTDGPCDAACASAGFDMVYALRQKFPQALFVMNNATSETVRTATLHGVTFPTLLDGVVHEGAFTEATPTTLASAAIYHVAPNAEILAQLDAWKSLDLVNACSNSTDARRVETLARARGYSPAISDKSAGLHVVCAVAP
jgi:cysteinyl-tRNA synthetase